RAIVNWNGRVVNGLKLRDFEAMYRRGQKDCRVNRTVKRPVERRVNERKKEDEYMLFEEKGQVSVDHTGRFCYTRAFQGEYDTPNARTMESISERRSQLFGWTQTRVSCSEKLRECQTRC
ncbi:hypothetical protein PIB30_063919, partial [Stylosanthes scabra]|nr:hypothetical protein [Stylosanthes scabra]